jgi:hypothetical protein
MTEAVQFIFRSISDIISVLDTTVFDFYNFRVSLWSLLLVFIIIGMFSSVWWKGARG